MGRWGCDRGEFTSTVHGKPPELWLPSRLQRLRSRVLKITSYSAAATHPPFHSNRLDPRNRVCNRRPNATNRSFLSRAFDPFLRLRKERRTCERTNEKRGEFWREGRKYGKADRKCNFENASNRRGGVGPYQRGDEGSREDIEAGEKYKHLDKFKLATFFFSVRSEARCELTFSKTSIFVKLNSSSFYLSDIPPASPLSEERHRPTLFYNA